MQKDIYKKIESYMLSCINDGAHDYQHIYRVLYHALDIAGSYHVDKDVLIAACLLHDIGRDAQFRNPKIDHAVVGAEMAYEFLIQIDWPQDMAQHVKACISTHRYRNNDQPISMEAKILFDSDRLDATYPCRGGYAGLLFVIIIQQEGSGFMERFKLSDGQTLIIRKAEIGDACNIINYINQISKETEYLTFGEGEFGIKFKFRIRRDYYAGILH